MPEGRPGLSSELSVYEPAGTQHPKSLACVLFSPGGGTLVCGPRASAGDDAVCRSYAKAGLAVVVFHADGEIDVRGAKAAEIAEASARFFAAQAGLVNARNALEFVLARMPEVDPHRIYVAGNGSAATLALLFAEHERRVAACIAYAPVIDVVARFKRLAPELAENAPAGLLTALERTSPSGHAVKLACPVCIVEVEGETKASLDEMRTFVNQLRAAGKLVSVIRATGNPRTMLASATRQTVRWLADPKKAANGDRQPPEQPIVAHQAPRVSEPQRSARFGSSASRAGKPRATFAALDFVSHGRGLKHCGGHRRRNARSRRNPAHRRSGRGTGQPQSSVDSPNA